MLCNCWLIYSGKLDCFRLCCAPSSGRFRKSSIFFKGSQKLCSLVVSSRYVTEYLQFWSTLLCSPDILFNSRSWNILGHLSLLNMLYFSCFCFLIRSWINNSSNTKFSIEKSIYLLVPVCLSSKQKRDERSNSNHLSLLTISFNDSSHSLWVGHLSLLRVSVTIQAI